MSSCIVSIIKFVHRKQINNMMKIAILLLLLISSSSLAQQWSPPVRISEVTGGYYPQILACGDTLHVVYQGDYPIKIEYIRSTDGGQSWGQQQILADTINTEYLTNPHVMQFEGDLLAIWHSSFVHGIYTYNIGYSHSSNGGVSWSVPQYVLENNLRYPFWLTASSSDSVVNIMISMMDYTIDSVGFYNIRSTNFGRNWSTPRRLFRSYGGGIMDQGSCNNFVHLVWNGRLGNAQRNEIYYEKSTDGGISWEPSIALSDTDQFHSQRPAIDVNKMGIPWVTWMDYKYTTQPFTGDILMRTSPDSGMIWDSEQQLTFNHFAFISTVISNGDTIQVAWEDESEGAVHKMIFYIRSIDGGINWDTPFWLDQTDDDSRTPALAVSNSRVYAIWYDYREPPEDIGLYFSRWDPGPDAIIGDNSHNQPDEIDLSAYPNPFNSNVIITLNSEKGGVVRICDFNGRLITKFVVGTGTKKIVWDAKGMDGERLSSGVFFVEFQNGGQSKTVKLIYVK